MTNVNSAPTIQPSVTANLGGGGNGNPFENRLSSSSPAASASPALITRSVITAGNDLFHLTREGVNAFGLLGRGVVPLCLFRPVSCCRGSLFNGFCAAHLESVFNVKMLKTEHDTGKDEPVEMLVSHIYEPFRREANMHRIISLPEFGVSNGGIFVNVHSVQDLNTEPKFVEYLRRIFTNDFSCTDPENRDFCNYSSHFIKMWLSYASSFPLPEGEWTWATVDGLMDLKRCTLLTQAIARIFTSSIYPLEGNLSVPNVFSVVKGTLCLNGSIAILGSRFVNCVGTNATSTVSLTLVPIIAPPQANNGTIITKLQIPKNC